MSDDTLDHTAVQAAADLGRRLAETGRQGRVAVDPADGDDSVTIFQLRQDENVEVIDVERYLDAPRRARGQAVFHDPESFARYVTDLDRGRIDEIGRSTVWADDEARKVIAVFNDHDSADRPGWRDHTATYTARVDPDWAAWREHDGKQRPQVMFGEFLQDMGHTISDPPAADLIDIATQFSAKRNVTYESSTRLQSGEVQLVYREETNTSTGKAKIEIPERFTLRLVPFVGAQLIEITARLRYRITDGLLTLGYKLQRPDIAEREAFNGLLDAIRAGLPDTVPVLGGTAPGPVK